MSVRRALRSRGQAPSELVDEFFCDELEFEGAVLAALRQNIPNVGIMRAIVVLTLLLVILRSEQREVLSYNGRNPLSSPRHIIEEHSGAAQDAEKPGRSIMSSNSGT